MNGHRVGIVGLNSTWLQLGAGPYQGKLALDHRQLLAVTGSDPDQWCRLNDVNLILTHHPLDWLSSKSRQSWPGEIDTNERFDIHLYGHMHEHDFSTVTRGGGQTRRSMQASSLFGLETYEGGKEARVQGYSLNQFHWDGESRQVRVWPRVLNLQKDQDRRITADTSLGLLNDQYFDVPCASRVRRATGSEASEALSAPPVPAAAKLIVSLASKPELIGSELEKIRHYLDNEPAHLNVRTLEKRSVCHALREGRVVWAISDWGMGEDGFLGAVQSDFNEAGCPTYSFDFSDYQNREKFLGDTQERFGVPFEVLCANIATVGMSYVIFKDIPIEREASGGQAPIAVDVEGIAKLLSEFAPAAKVILRATRAPRGSASCPLVELKALDEADVAVYLREHPQGGKALGSPEIVGTLYRHTDGVPSRLDNALRKLGVSSLKTVVKSDTDLGDRSVVTPFPQALVNAVAHVENAQKSGLGFSFDLLKALASLPRGDQIESIARLNGASKLRPEDALLLIDRGLIDSAPVNTLGPDNDGTGEKTLMVPRPVREYVRSRLTEAQARTLDRKMVELYFGKNWTSGKITGSRAGRNASTSLCEMNVVHNSCTLISRHIRLAVSKGDQVQIEAGIRLASAFVACLKKGNHHRTAASLCAEVLELVPIEGYARQRTILEFDLARNLRMTKNTEEALDLLSELDETFLSKEQRQIAQLNLAMIFDGLDQPDNAIKAARKCISTDGRSSYALHAKSILIAQENEAERRRGQLENLRSQSSRKKSFVVANNIGLTLAVDARAAGNFSEALLILRDVLNSAAMHKDFYNGARAIADVAECLPSGIPFEPRDRDQLIDAYYFAHTERLASLFDRCHSGLWKAFEAEGDIENLLRLYRSSSFIWRLHGRENIERTYLKKLRALREKMAGDSSDREYFFVRVILVFGDSVREA